MLYERVKASFTPTKGVERDKWLEIRRRGLGGSDAGAVMGLNPYKTPLMVYYDKKGLGLDNAGEACKWGNLLEEPVRQRAREDLGATIEAVPGMLTSEVNTFMCANLDGLMLCDKPVTLDGKTVEGLGGHEIKTSRTGAGFGSDEVPDSYYAQVQHYMAVTGLKWFVLSVYIIERYEVKHYVVERNESFIKDLTAAEESFWQGNILKDEPPAPVGNEWEDAVIDALPTGGESVVLGDSFLPLIEKKAELDAKIKELSKELLRVKDEIKEGIVRATTGKEVGTVRASCKGYKVSYLLTQSHSLDTQALRKAGLYDKYAITRTYRQLRITEGK